MPGIHLVQGFIQLRDGLIRNAVDSSVIVEKVN